MNILWTFISFHWSLNYLVLKNSTELIKWLATFFTPAAFLSGMNYQVFQKFLVQKTVCFLSQMNPLNRKIGGRFCHTLHTCNVSLRDEFSGVWNALCAFWSLCHILHTCRVSPQYELICVEKGMTESRRLCHTLHTCTASLQNGLSRDLKAARKF